MKNNSNITKDVERIRHEEALRMDIKRLTHELYKADKENVRLMVDNDRLMSEKDALIRINKQLQDDLEKLRNDNLQLIEQIGCGEIKIEISQGSDGFNCKIKGENNEHI